MAFMLVKHCSMNLCMSWDYCSVWSLYTYHVLNKQQISLASYSNKGKSVPLKARGDQRVPGS
jgi:hypothetical protein